jgi:hypothetical protein
MEPEEGRIGEYGTGRGKIRGIVERYERAQGFLPKNIEIRYGRGI